MAKRILKHALLGLDFLYGNDVVHADFQTGNLLFSLSGLEDIHEAKLTQDMTDTTSPLERLDRKEDKWAPPYLTLPQHLFEFANLEAKTAHVKISDFGAGKNALTHPHCMDS